MGYGWDTHHVYKIEGWGVDHDNRGKKMLSIICTWGISVIIIYQNVNFKITHPDYKKDNDIWSLIMEFQYHKIYILAQMYSISRICGSKLMFTLEN